LSSVDDVSSPFSLPCICSASLRVSARLATPFSTPMLQTAGNKLCSKRKHFNRPRSFSLFSLFFERLPSPDTNAVTDSFHGIELGLPLLLLFTSRSERLAPYCFSTFLAGIHNYRAGTHNYFFTIRTRTTVHHGLPLGGWYYTMSFLFSSVWRNRWPLPASPGLQSCRAWPPRP